MAEDANTAGAETMRVIAGQARGTRLRTLRGRRTRPTSDRVRESLFNILGTHVQDAEMLDLFAGSGSVGVEALSRGARHVVFVEKDPGAAQIIRQNLLHTRQAPRAEVRVQHALVAARQLARQGQRFSLIFLDPPYDRDWPALTLRVLAETGILSAGGIIVVEHGRRETVPAQVEDIELTRQNTYGDSALSFYQLGRPIEPWEEDRDAGCHLPGEL
ncbi:MAG TPA: 16S rRNA (guanine(966)-N(2))-methyltransferase RsmD [Bacillota bacterium]|nr:16S rRNA (guanine(966)-N(2))-methyltransferase RsmD [Bacillota bacterium]